MSLWFGFLDTSLESKGGKEKSFVKKESELLGGGMDN